MGGSGWFSKGTARGHYLYGDLQPRFGVPGGDIDVEYLRDYFRVLLEHDLIGPEKRPYVSAEVRPLLAEENSALVIANTKRVMREAWALA